MKGGKRYWFKLYNNFFDNEKIKQIKRKKDGDRLIVIFINCLAITANCESGGYLKISENKFFTIETLAHHMGRNQKSIENALDIFQEYSMIVQDEYGYKIKNWNNYQNLQEKGIKDKKESTLPEQIGFACVCVTVLIVVMLIVRKHWRNRQFSS